MKPTGIVALSQILPYWPEAFGQPKALDAIGLLDTQVHGGEGGLFVTSSLVWTKEIEMALPLVSGISVVLLSGNGFTAVPFEIDVLPNFAVSIPNIEFAMRFQSDLLVPVVRQNKKWVPALDGDGKPKVAELRFGGLGFRADLGGNIGFTGSPKGDLPPVMIGKSGVVVEMKGLTPYLSASQTPPANAPASFRGLAITAINVYLPDDLDVPLLPTSIQAQDLLIGTGGFSGKLTGLWTPSFDVSSGAYQGDGSGKLFGIPFALQSLSIEFRQNVPIESELKGEMLLPFFDQRVGVDLSVGFDGSISLALAKAQIPPASATDGLLTFERSGILRMEVDSVGFDLHDGVFVAKLSGKLTPLFGADKGLKWPSFDVKELSIDSQGHVHLAGGWLDLPRQQTLDFYGFKIEITQLGFGKNDDGGKWIGFSGALHLVDGLRGGASVEGLRVTWYDDGREPKISLNGAGVELLIPDVLYLKGEVSFHEITDPTTGELIRRFDGDIHLLLETPELEIDGTLVIGSDKKPAGRFNFFAIYVDVDLPTGIPLAATGLGIYGLAGLFALQMEPDKHPAEMWFSIDHGKSFYHRDTPGITDLDKKWVPRQGSFAIGAGVTLGTLADNGYTFNGKFLLAIVVPGPIVLLQGAAQFLTKRAGKDQEGEFRALAVLDGRAGSLLIGLDAEYKTGKGGELIEIGGSMEAFYAFHDPTAWHLYLGRDEPRSLRIRALLASLFEANAYFMLDAHQLALGAWFGYDGGWSFGPLSITLQAWAEGNALLSFKPTQFHGDLWLHAQVGLHAFGIGLDLGLDARIAADLFKPHHLLGVFSVGIKPPWPFKKIAVTVTLEWGPDPIMPRLPLPVVEIAVESLKSGVVWPLARHEFLLPNYDDGGFLRLLGSAGPSTPAGASPLVPLDGRIAITFGRSVHDGALVGVPPMQVDPPTEDIGHPPDGVNVTYVLDSLTLERWDPIGTAWKTVAHSPKSGTLPTLFGTWVPVPQLPAPTTPPKLGQTKLLLWSKTPFDFTRHTGSSWEEWVTDALPGYPCPPVRPAAETCFGFDALEPGTRVESPWTWPGPPAVTLSWDFGPATVETRTVARGGVQRPVPVLCFPDRAAQRGVRVQPQVPATRFRIFLAPPAAKPQPPAPASALATSIAGDILTSHLVPPTCSDLRRRQAGTLANPWTTEEGIRFTVRGADGQPLPVGRIERWGTGALGLNAGFRLDLELPCASPFVDLLVTHRPPFRIVAFDAAGAVVATHAPNGAGGEVTEAVHLAGPAITRLEVHAAGNEKLVHQACFLCVQPTGPQATGYDVHGAPHGPFLPIDGVITVPGPGLPKLVVTGDGGFCLQQICVTPDPEAGQLVRRDEAIQHLRDELFRWQLDGAVLAPNTSYRLTVRTHLGLSNPGLAEAPIDLSPTEHAYFRTEGPPGLTRLLPPEGVPPEHFDSGLDDLTRYVHETDPPTVPPPGQQPILFKPFYRAYDVGVQFNEDYVEQMYVMDGRDLGLYLFDGSNQPVRDARGRLLALAPAWQRTETLSLEESETRWLTLLNAATCLPEKLDPATFPHDAALASAEERVLAADTLHEARLVPLLLHEGFTAGEVGHVPPGWAAADDGPGAPSAWRLGEAGEPAARYVEQGSDLGSAAEPDRPGTVLLLADSAALPATDAAQPFLWTDVRASVYARSAAGGAVGIVFRHGGPGSWYHFALDARGRRLVKAGPGGVALLASDHTSYQRNRDYLLTVEAIGSDVRTYVDGEPVFAVTDGKPADLGALAQGRVGLYTCQSPGARFADLRVDDFRKAAPVAYRFQFTTSLYANFFHHLHGFDDAPWSGALVPDAAVPDVSAQLGLAVAASFDPPGEAEARAYEALATLALQAAALQRSARVEVTRLTRPGGGPVLLLRSPEPLDWQRVELALFRPAHSLGVPSRPGDLKLTDVAFGTLGPAEEAVTVLLRGATPPTRYRIESQELPGPLAEPGGDPILLLESFGDPGALARFQVVNSGTGGGPSQWQVEGGALLQLLAIAGGAEPELPGTQALAGDPAWTDYRLAAELRSDAGSAVGVVFRWADADNHYRLSADARLRYRRLVKRQGGAVTILWEDAGSYSPGEPFRLEVEAVGARLTGYLDGVRLFAVADAALAAGQVGIYAWNDPTARCERLEVRLPSLEGRALLADAFAAPGSDALAGWSLLSEVTGVPLAQAASWETAGGALHLRSLLAQGTDPDFPGALAAAGDTGWTGVLLQVRLHGKGGAIGVVFRAQDLANYYRFAMSRERGARQLVRRAGGQAQVLWQDDVLYEVDRPYELTVAAVGSSLRGWLDGVPLFAVEDAAVPAGRIALYAWNHQEAWFSGVRVWAADQAFAGWRLDEPFAAAVPGRWTFLAESGQPDPFPWTLGGGALRAEAEPASWEAAGGGVDGAIHALAAAAGSSLGGDPADVADLYVGGDLTHAGGIAANGIARWFGGAWQALGAGVDGTVSALAVDGDRVYMGGSFTSAGGSPASNVAVWDRAAGTWSALGAGVGGPVFALAVAGGQVYAGGQFSTAGTAAASNLAAWDRTTGAWSAVGGGVDAPVLALAASGGQLLVGGRFSHAGGMPASRIALWGGTSWLATGGATNGPVSAIAVGEGIESLYIGGGFTQAGGVAAARIAHWTGVAWVPLGSGMDGPVDAMLLDGNQLWVAGRFTTAGGIAASRIARWNVASQTWSAVGEGLAGAGAAFALAGDRLWVGGDFPASATVPAPRIAALRLGGTRFALAAGEAPADFRLAVRLVPGADGAAAVVVGHAGAGHHLALWLDAEHGRRRLVRTAGGAGEVLWQDAVRPVAGRETAVTLDVVGSRLTGHADGVLLFDLELAPAAGQIGLALRRSPAARVREVRLAEPAWTAWYAFGEEGELLAGTRVRIHGAPPPAATPREPGVALRSIALAGEAGRLRLRPRGAELRLVAPDGSVGHSRAFLGPDAYSLVPDVKVLRKADGTGLLLLPGGDAGAGPLRLQLTYHRDRQEAGRPFRQAGDKSAEVVTIDVP